MFIVFRKGKVVNSRKCSTVNSLLSFWAENYFRPNRQHAGFDSCE